MARRRIGRTSRTGPVRIFISHASEDADVAAAVVELLRTALNVPAEAIRCTSVDGYRLPGGASFESQLKREVHLADAFIGIVSPASIRSIYVLFELGARWGAERHMLPLLAPGVPASVLRGPIANLSALRVDHAGELQQFTTDVAKQVRVRAAKPATYQLQLDRLLALPARQLPEANAIATLRNEKSALDHQIKQVVPTVKRLTLDCSFDESGSGEQVRRWMGIRSRQTLVDCRIPYTFTASSPAGKAIPHAKLVKEIRRPRHSALAARFEAAPVSNEKTLQGNIVIVGPLTANTGFVGFEIRQPFENAFCMTREEVAAAYRHDAWKTEYVGILVQFPTKTLEVVVKFPRSFRHLRPRPRPIVFFSSTEKVHERETTRAEKDFTFRQRKACLRLFDPIPGLQYAIYWMPPS